MYDLIMRELLKINLADKYEPVSQKIYLFGSSLYMISKHMIVDVDLAEFTSAKFKRCIAMPINGCFEESDDVVGDELSWFLAVRKRALNHCGTLVFVKKELILEYIESHYGSFAKANKMQVSVVVDKSITLNFLPVKKSASVMHGEIKDELVIVPRPCIRSQNTSVHIKLLPLYLALKNCLLGDIARLEIDDSKQMLKLSCLYNGLKVKFSIFEEDNFIS